MLTRRQFCRNSALWASLLSASPRAAWAAPEAPLQLDSRRPQPESRTFSSSAIEARINFVKKRIGDPELAWLFENCYPNTLDTTVHSSTVDGRPDTFVVTGDINAMWLRDSSAQVWPYLPLAASDIRLRELFQGLIARQARCVMLDPYANAFTPDPNAMTEHKGDHTEMKPGVFERKYELDSLCYVMRLAHGYWRLTRDPVPFDTAWRDSARLILTTLREQQRKHGQGSYSFQRQTTSPTETLYRGYGYPTRPVGLIHTGFRPSDDAGIFPFLIPANHFAVVALRGLASLLQQTVGDHDLAAEANLLAAEVAAALAVYGMGNHPDYGQIYAYEADGLGNVQFMDDANVPSLLALPYLGACSANDPTYLRTRRFVQSPSNPYFFRGSALEGVGSPHTGLGRVWPVAITMRALTSTDDLEIRSCLRMLKISSARTGFMHEGVDKDDPTQFSRTWFAWANSLFGELIGKLADTRPHLLGA